MGRVELKNWSKEKVRGKRWDILLPMIIVGFISGFVTITVRTDQKTFLVSFGLLSLLVSIVAFIMKVGFTDYMVKFIKDKSYQVELLFSKFGDWIRLLTTYLLQSIYIFLWALLFIIPGIIKALAYSLVPYLLADDKYSKLSAEEVLKKSEELMNGNKWKLVVLFLSFLGWHFVACFTLFILEIWIIPYQKVATTKFLRDILEASK